MTLVIGNSGWDGRISWGAFSFVVVSLETARLGRFFVEGNREREPLQTFWKASQPKRKFRVDDTVIKHKRVVLVVVFDDDDDDLPRELLQRCFLFPVFSLFIFDFGNGDCFRMRYKPLRYLQRRWDKWFLLTCFVPNWLQIDCDWFSVFQRWNKI